MSSPKRGTPAAVTGSLRPVAEVPGCTTVAANDNSRDPQGDALLRAALRLFAQHGLGAGHRAQAQAEEAFFLGDRDGYRWWLAVTRALDRKLAVELSGRMGSDLFGSQGHSRS